jgi:hypothetical protein
MSVNTREALINSEFNEESCAAVYAILLSQSAALGKEAANIILLEIGDIR